MADENSNELDCLLSDNQLEATWRGIWTAIRENSVKPVTPEEIGETFRNRYKEHVGGMRKAFENFPGIPDGALDKYLAAAERLKEAFITMMIDEEKSRKEKSLFNCLFFRV